jgi:thiol:disulfide interchange protein DsbA
VAYGAILTYLFECCGWPRRDDLEQKEILMKAVMNAVLAAVLLAVIGTPARAAQTWTEGVNYFLIQPAKPTSLPHGKVEVTEVFSYACPACNVFQPTVHKLKQSLPPNAVLDFLPASFNSAEDWPMFQLAFLTAQVLGIDAKTHDAMFDAVWKGGDLSVVDPITHQLKGHAPTIEDAAAFYSKQTGTPVDKFLAASKSFAVDVKVRGTEDLLAAYKVDRTPTIVVNGKYRLQAESAGGPDQLVELVNWLVAKESK